jgi:hypothetical protein
MSLGTITVHPTLDGTPTVRWELKAHSAETLLAMLAKVALADPSSEAAVLLDDLADAINEAEALSQPVLVDGCAGLWPDAEPYILTAPAVLSDGAGLCAVLLPGRVPMLDAIDIALTEANATGANLDRTDTTLMADYHTPRWALLHRCDMDGHDFHPELASRGAHTPGAVLVTQVDFTHVNADT